MIDRNEEKLLKKTYIYSSCCWAVFLVALFIGLYFLVLQFIADEHFTLEYGDPFTFGLYAYLLIVIIYLALFIYMVVYLVKIRKTNALDDIHDEGFTSLADLYEKDKEYRKNKTMHLDVNTGILKSRSLELLVNNNLKVPSVKKWFLGILILPLAVLTLVYGTHFGLVKMTMSEQFKIAKVSIDKLETAFNSVCFETYHNNDEYKSYGYSITGYLYDYAEIYNAYVTVYVDNDGLIDSIYYEKDIDVTISKEENLEALKNDFSVFHDMITSADVKATDDFVLSEPSLNDVFLNQFLNGSYYDEISYYNENYGISYYTYEESEFNEYTVPYIYLSYTDY